MPAPHPKPGDVYPECPTQVSFWKWGRSVSEIRSASSIVAPHAVELGPRSHCDPCIGRQAFDEASTQDPTDAFRRQYTAYVCIGEQWIPPRLRRYCWNQAHEDRFAQLLAESVCYVQGTHPSEKIPSMSNISTHLFHIKIRQRVLFKSTVRTTIVGTSSFRPRPRQL